MDNFPLVNNAKILPLTDGYFCLIDADLPDELRWIFEYSWYAHKSRNGVYARNRTHGMLHRALKKCPKHLETDHKNLNTLDNRLSNLRNCTRRTNAKNRNFDNMRREK